MTGGMTNRGGHLDEGALLRAIDGQLAADERAQVEAHLAECGECARARADLAGIAARVSSRLDRAIAAPEQLPRHIPRLRARQPAVSRLRRPLMAASVVFLALLASLAFPQGRAFALGLWRMLHPDAPIPADTAVRVVDPPARQGDRVLIEVTPTERRMVIELAAENSEGTITVEPHPSHRLVLRSVTSPAVLVFPSALRVSNESTPRGDFRVLVPPSVDELVVRVRDRQVCRAQTTAQSECRFGPR
jgi:hypothetical protein